MDKKPLIVVSLCAVFLLVLGSLSNVVGYQSVQTSQQNLIKERINQRELLFQTIVDIANNKEIQRIILKSQMIRGIFPTSELSVVTKNQLKMMYFLGMILSKVISKSRIQSMIGKYQFSNQETQKEINAVIEKDTTLNSGITQLKNSGCDCENENAAVWHFPIICTILLGLFLGGVRIGVFLFYHIPNSQILQYVFLVIGVFMFLILYNFFFLHETFNCSW
jgi:hypothetical protein